MSDSDIFDLSDCTLCPRACHANRTAGQTGFCHVPARPFAGRAALLTCEEPCLTGRNGSGAVFFSGCNLGCIFCQNHEISRGSAGLLLDPAKLSNLFLSLQEQGSATLNLVTASHYLPLIVPALEKARSHGLRIPVIYNTGAYEKKEAIRRLDGLIDVYLPDLKYCSDELAIAYSRAPRYFEYASAAIAEMVRQCPEPLFSNGARTLELEEESAEDFEYPLMQKGVIVRHLALPGAGEDSRRILSYLYKTYGDHIFISLMNQYTPMPAVAGHPRLHAALSDEDYEALCDYAVSLGISNGFFQEGGTVSESFIPAFDGSGLEAFSVHS